MYKAIDFPSPLLLFLALFLCLALSCSLFLSLVVVVVVSGLSPDWGLSSHPRLSPKKAIFGVPSDTLSQKMRFRVGHLHFLNLKN